MSTLDEAFAKRSAMNDKVIKALAHLPRDQALGIVLSYVPIDYLEEVLPTICGSDRPVEDPVEAFLIRVRMAQSQYGLRLLIEDDKSKSRKIPDHVVRAFVKQIVP